MPLFERIDADLVAARKRRDALALATLGLLKSEVVKAGKEPGADGSAPDELVLRVIRREVKRRDEAAAAFAAAGRAESAARERSEAEVLQVFLPTAIGDDELEREVRAVVDELRPQGPRDLGAVMKAASTRLRGRAEGGRIAAVAKRLIGA